MWLPGRCYVIPRVLWLVSMVLLSDFKGIVYVFARVLWMVSKVLCDY